MNRKHRTSNPAKNRPSSPRFSPFSLPLALLLVVVVACVVWAWLFSEHEPEGLQGAVVILLDTVRADHLSCYGYERKTTPFLEEIADQGTLFEEAVTFAPWTLPAMATFFSGCRLSNRVFDNRLNLSLIEAFRQAGFRTAAFTEGGFVSKYFGFDLGFDSYREEEGAVQRLAPDKLMNAAAKGGIENTFNEARAWLSAHKNERFLLFLHTYEAHAPYERPAFTQGLEPGAVGKTFTLDKPPLLQEGRLRFSDSDLKYLAALYDGGILECDGQIAGLCDHLKTLGLDKSTLLVVTSDHGEEMGEHYRNYAGDHGHSLHDDLVHVPLVIRNSCESYPVKRVPTQVRLMDTLVTVADILDVPLSGPLDGKSLLPLMRGENNEALIADGGATKAGPARQYVRWFGYKLIRVIGPSPEGAAPVPEPKKVQLYDLKADPLEQVDLAGRDPALLDKMTRIADGLMGKTTVIDPFSEGMDPALEDRLRSLGYLK